MKTANSASQTIHSSAKSYWNALAPRERRLITIASVTLAASLYVWFLITGSVAGKALRDRLPELRMQALTLEQQAVELEQLRLLPAPMPSDTSLLVLVQEVMVVAGISDMLTTSQAVDVNHVMVEFGTIPFPLWIDWVNTLSGQGIRVESISMETLLTPGLVSTKATLGRAVSQ